MPKHTLPSGLWMPKTAHSYNAAMEASGNASCRLCKHQSSGKMFLFLLASPVFPTQSLLSSVLASLVSPCLWSIQPSQRQVHSARHSALVVPSWEYPPSGSPRTCGLVFTI